MLPHHSQAQDHLEKQKQPAIGTYEKYDTGMCMVCRVKEVVNFGRAKVKNEFFVISRGAIEFRADGIISLRLELFLSDRHLA